MSVWPSKGFTRLSKQLRSPLLPASLSMVLMGATLVITGALLPSIALDLSLTSAQVGLLASSPAVGYVIAAALAGALGDRFGFKKIWLTGVIAGMIALIWIALTPSFTWLLPAVSAMGLVTGFIDGSVNPLVAILSSGSSGSTLNRVHLFFGLGATVAPLLISLGLSAGLPWRWHYGLLALYVLIVGVSIQRASYPKWTRAANEQGAFAKRLIQRAIALPLLAMLIYGGTEASLLSWIPLYLERVRSIPLTATSLGVSVFSGALLLGRAVCSGIAERIGYQRLIVGSAALGAVGVGLMLILPGQVLPWGAIAIAGFSLAGFFATAIADVTRRAPEYAGALAGLACSANGLGKIILPWAVGQVAQGTSLTAGLWLVVIAAALMALLYSRS